MGSVIFYIIGVIVCILIFLYGVHNYYEKIRKANLVKYNDEVELAKKVSEQIEEIFSLGNEDALISNYELMYFNPQEVFLSYWDGQLDSFNNMPSPYPTYNNFHNVEYCEFTNYNTSGVYIIYNYTKNKAYVGQSKNMGNRVRSHLNGNGGNKDVYMDNSRGNIFYVSFIGITTNDLNRCEADTIMLFRGFRTGYNSTRGNGVKYDNPNFIPKLNNKLDREYFENRGKKVDKIPVEEYLNEIKYAPYRTYIDNKKFISMKELNKINFPVIKGVYIIFNKSTGMYYVGQSMNIGERLKSHLKGYGSSDVYKSIVNDDNVLMTFIEFNNNFNDLDEMERRYITHYDSYNNGYNRTRGNFS